MHTLTLTLALTNLVLLCECGALLPHLCYQRRRHVPMVGVRVRARVRVRVRVRVGVRVGVRVRVRVRVKGEW